MTATFTQQYYPISTAETSSNDALSVRALRDKEFSINNYVNYIASGNKTRTWACVGDVLSQDAGTDNKVTTVFAPVHVPRYFKNIRIWVNHSRSAGANNTTWYCYFMTKQYKGPSVFDVNKIIGNYCSLPWTTSSASHAIYVGNCTLPERPKNDLWLMLVSQNSVSGTRSKIWTLDACAYG